MVIDNLSVLYTGRNILSMAPRVPGRPGARTARAGLGRRMQRLRAWTPSPAMRPVSSATAVWAEPAPATIPSETTMSTGPTRRGLGLETAIEFSGRTFDVTDVVVEGNVFYHCSAAMLCFNWDEGGQPGPPVPQHQFPGQLCLYSAMSNWTDIWRGGYGYTTGSFTIDGGPNMQDGTVEVQDNVFFLPRGSVWCISGPMCPEYLPDFEGNCYAQFSDRVFPLQCLRPLLLGRKRRGGRG